MHSRVGVDIRRRNESLALLSFRLGNDFFATLCEVNRECHLVTKHGDCQGRSEFWCWNACVHCGVY